MNVLIVDDSQFIKNMIKRIVVGVCLDCSAGECSKAHITEASDGKEAIKAMTQNRFDVIITDMEMGENGGDEFIKKLMHNPLLKNKKVIIYSSNKSIVDSLGVLPENMCFVDKTLGKNVLEAKIIECFKCFTNNK